MKKMGLRSLSGISTNALAKMGKNQSVSTKVIEKICLVLNCQIEDIMEITGTEENTFMKEEK